MVITPGLRVEFAATSGFIRHNPDWGAHMHPAARALKLGDCGLVIAVVDDMWAFVLFDDGITSWVPKGWIEHYE